MSQTSVPIKIDTDVDKDYLSNATPTLSEEGIYEYVVATLTQLQKPLEEHFVQLICQDPLKAALIPVQPDSDQLVYFEARVKRYTSKESQRTLNEQEYLEWTVCLLILGLICMELRIPAESIMKQAYEKYQKSASKRDLHALLLACLTIHELRKGDDEKMQAFIKEMKSLYTENTDDSSYYNLGILSRFIFKQTASEFCLLDAERYLLFASILNARLYEYEYRLTQQDLVCYHIQHNHCQEAQNILDNIRGSNLANRLMSNVGSGLNLLCMMSRRLSGEEASRIYMFIRENLDKFRVDTNRHALVTAENLLLQFCHEPEKHNSLTIQEALDRYAEAFQYSPQKVLLSKSKFLSMVLHDTYLKELPFTEKEKLMLSVDILRSYNHLLHIYFNVDYDDSDFNHLSVRRYTDALFSCVANLQNIEVPKQLIASLVLKYINIVENIIEARQGRNNMDNANYYGDIFHAYRLLTEIDPTHSLVSVWKTKMESNRQIGEELMFIQNY